MVRTCTAQHLGLKAGTLNAEHDCQTLDRNRRASALTGKSKPTTYDEYLERAPEQSRAKLDELRAIVRSAAPEAEEVISYSIPAYKFHGWLMYISGYKGHVSISMLPDTFETFTGNLSSYKTSKSAVQFPLDKPLPEQLIRDLIAHRVAMNLASSSS
jgi:uncharacterized protein YdhG (YjbR/CyaY superfamily)